MLVTVDSSSSESDSEESKPDSPDSSDSDGLENWMILGRETQDGDQTISLNLEGGSDGNSGASLFMCGLICMCVRAATNHCFDSRLVTDY